MKSSKITQVTTILTLNQDEADWLRGVIQNPLGNDPNPANEDPVDKEMRERFWKALI